MSPALESDQEGGPEARPSLFASGVAHRLSTPAHADLIVVLDDGHVTEAGTHPELVGARGVYASLVAAQTDSRS